MATYRNDGARTAEFTVGSVPGSPPQRFCVAPGETCELAEGYAEYVAQYSLCLVPAATPTKAQVAAKESANLKRPDEPVATQPTPSVATRASEAAIKQAPDDRGRGQRKRQRGKK